MIVKSREYEFDFLVKKLGNFIRDKQSGLLHITGVPGSGKTYTVKKVVEMLTSHSIDSKKNADFNKEHIEDELDNNRSKNLRYKEGSDIDCEGMSNTTQNNHDKENNCYKKGVIDCVDTSNVMHDSYNKHPSASYNSLVNTEVDFIYINCNDVKSKRNIFFAILKSIRNTKKKKFTRIVMKNKKHTNYYYDQCKHALIKSERSYIILLDEIDLLNTKNQDILYTLVNLPFYEDISLFLVTISNSFHLESKVASRIGDNKLTFKPYKSDQLLSILDCDKETSKYIARRIGAISGDARRALNLSKKCKNMSVIEAEKRIREESQQLAFYFLPSLTKYQKLFLMCYIENEHIDFYYEEFCSACKLRNLDELDFLEFRIMLRALIEQGIIEHHHNKTITFYLLKEEIENILKNDKTYLDLRLN